MARADTHSRLVGWFKVALPLAALALLSTLFLLADRIDPSDAIPYAEVDVDDLVRDPRMTDPTYAGTTADGGAITVTAASARPANDNSAAEAAGVTVNLTMPDGGTATLAAGDVRLDNAAGTLSLSGGVQVDTSSGYRLITDAVEARLDRSFVTGSFPITATGPMGQIEASGFTLERDQDGGEYLLVFSGRVKLIYLPGGD